MGRNQEQQPRQRPGTAARCLAAEDDARKAQQI